MFPLQNRNSPWSGDCSPVPVAGIHPEGGQNLGLEGVPPGDDADAAIPGVELDPTDAVELGKGPACREHLAFEVGVHDASLGEVLGHHRFDGRGQHAEGDVAVHPCSVKW